MLIAYLTADEVNEDLATRMAEEAGATLIPLTVRDPPPNGHFNAVVYDWDYLPAARRQRILADVLSCPPHCPVALHGYNLDDQQAQALRERGVAVFHHLKPEVSRLLVLMIRKHASLLAA